MTVTVLGASCQSRAPCSTASLRASLADCFLLFAAKLKTASLEGFFSSHTNGTEIDPVETGCGLGMLIGFWILLPCFSCYFLLTESRWQPHLTTTPTSSSTSSSVSEAFWFVSSHGANCDWFIGCHERIGTSCKNRMCCWLELARINQWPVSSLFPPHLMISWSVGKQIILRNVVVMIYPHRGATSTSLQTHPNYEQICQTVAIKLFQSKYPISATISDVNRIKSILSNV